jgi:hypothetical protein
LGFQFWTPQNIPFESSSISFVCAHPFDFVLVVVFFHPPSIVHREISLRIRQFLIRDWEEFHVHVFGCKYLWWPLSSLSPLD